MGVWCGVCVWYVMWCEHTYVCMHVYDVCIHAHRGVQQLENVWCPSLSFPTEPGAILRVTKPLLLPQQLWVTGTLNHASFSHGFPEISGHSKHLPIEPCPHHAHFFLAS